MLKPSSKVVRDPAKPSDAAEFLYDANGPISLSELAESFAAIDRIYALTAPDEERLAVTEIRSGSIIAVLAPVVPVLGQAMVVMGATVTVGDFVRRVRAAINALAGIDPEPIPPSTESGMIATELAQVLKPLAGRQGSRFGVAHVKYRSRTQNRTVELEATYDSTQIDRAAINADRYASLTSSESLAPDVEPSQEPILIKKVTLAFHQANRGPAKMRGHTGDKGTIESVSSKPLPVYFAKTVNDLKTKMVGIAKNPLKVSYVVDVLVTRENGEPKAYTVIEVYGAARAARKASLPLLKVQQRGTKRLKSS
jgi:hypothetical protein